MLYEKAVLKNIHRETPVLKSLFNKETTTRAFSCEYCKIFKNTYFKEHLRVSASVFYAVENLPKKKNILHALNSL